jgi:hypothetical protein
LSERRGPLRTADTEIARANAGIRHRLLIAVSGQAYSLGLRSR